MLRVHLLSDGFRSPNGRALAFPLLVLREPLARAGLRIRIFDRLADDLTECDVVMIDSKFFRDWWSTRADETLPTLEGIARQRPTLWFDTGDSAGWIKPEVLPFVRRYYKNQLYRDRRTYLRPLYGHRLYTDFYHRQFGVDDSAPSVQPPLSDPADLDKLAVSWNSGLADYSTWGPWLMALYHRLPWRGLLTFPRNFHPPAAPRANSVSCRFGITYERASVAFQRREIARRIADRLPTEKLKRPAYVRELRDSRVVISPFGLGEITLKDYEVLLSGALLLKPRMDAVETWPDLFVDGDTMVGFEWDMSDLESRLQEALDDPDRAAAIAADGQERYRHHVATAAGYQEFVNRVSAMVHEAVQ